MIQREPRDKPEKEQFLPSGILTSRAALPGSGGHSKVNIWRIRKEDPGCLLATACFILYGVLTVFTLLSLIAPAGDFATNARSALSVWILTGCLVTFLALTAYGCHWLGNQAISALLPSKKKRILSKFERKRLGLHQQSAQDTKLQKGGSEVPSGPLLEPESDHYGAKADQGIIGERGLDTPEPS